MDMGCKGFALILSISLVLSGCATVGNGQPQSALDRSINDCVASVAAGAILGALIGAADHNAGKGAAIGAGAGVVACAAIVAINNAQDRERIRQAQLASAASNNGQTQRYVGSDGTKRTVTTHVTEQPMPKSVTALADGDTIVGPCRNVAVDIGVEGKGNATVPADLFCRTSAGNWVAASSNGRNA